MKAVVSVLGEDQVGIIAKVSTLLAQKQINILDVSQTIMDGNFVIMNLQNSVKRLALKLTLEMPKFTMPCIIFNMYRRNIP